MRYQIDEEARLFHLDLNSGVSAETALGEVLAIIKARPELWGWDWIVEADTTPCDASFEQIARLASAFDTPPSFEVLTLLVSRDASLPMWARVMDFQFPRRRHVVVLSLDEARDEIRRHRA